MKKLFASFTINALAGVLDYTAYSTVNPLHTMLMYDYSVEVV